MIIPQWSNDKWCYKKAALKSYVARALSHCSTHILFNEEMKTIFEISKKHGYSRKLIQKIYKETLDRQERNNHDSQELESRQDCTNPINRGYEVIPDTLRGYKIVERLLKINEKKPAYKRPKTIFNTLKNVKDKYGQEECTGVYEIPLVNLDKQRNEVYIRATKRNLRERLKEHERDIKNGVLTTALAKRAYECNVRIGWQNAKVVKQLYDVNEIAIAEELQIFTGSNKGRVINERQSINISDAWKFALHEKTATERE